MAYLIVVVVAVVFASEANVQPARADEEDCSVQAGAQTVHGTSVVTIEGDCRSSESRDLSATFDPTSTSPHNDFEETSLPSPDTDAPSSPGSGSLALDRESDARESDARESDPPPIWALEPSFGTREQTGELCIALDRSSVYTTNDRMALIWEAQMLTMLGDPRLSGAVEPFCNEAAFASNADGLSFASNNGARGNGDPTDHVRRFLQTVSLPDPEFTIAPGYAVTGMPAYLEIHGQHRASITRDLEGFGTLAVMLSVAGFQVDWGDGTIAIVDDGRTGAPYDGSPAEQISHEYLFPDPDGIVTVTTRWVATWQLGDFHGAVTDLRSAARLALPVRTLVSVRTGPPQPTR